MTLLVLSTCLTTENLQEREKRVQESLRTSSREAKQLRTEMERLEVVNNNLQGYGLDEMTDEDIHVLIARSQQVKNGRPTVSPMPT